MKTNIEKVYSKLPQKKHNFGKHKIDLGLLDDLRERKASVDEAIEFVKTDTQEIAPAISKIRMALTEMAEHYNMADALEEDYISFSDKADELGIEIPQEAKDADGSATELRRVTEELEKLIDGL
jgi:hypothetical protein